MVQRTSWNCLLSALASRAEASILAYIILTWPIKIGAAFSADRRLCVLVTFTFQISSRLTPFWLHFYRASLSFSCHCIDTHRPIFVSSLRLNIGSTASISSSHRAAGKFQRSKNHLYRMASRAERPSKKQRRLSTDSEGTEEGYEWAGVRAKPKSRAEKATSSKKE